MKYALLPVASLLLIMFAVVPEPRQPFIGASTAIVAGGPPVPSHRVCFGRAVSRHGSPGNDTILGSPGNDVIKAGRGDDVVFAGPGNDFICGNRGGDILIGGDGFDHANGGAGDDNCEAERQRKCE